MSSNRSQTNPPEKKEFVSTKLQAFKSLCLTIAVNNILENPNSTEITLQTRFSLTFSRGQG
jgi:hypothetical protein